MIRSIFFIASLVAAVNAFGDGAPPDVCNSLIPGHPADPQTGESPYKITVDKVEIHPGDEVKVTLEGLNGEKFKGFIVEARVGNDIVGSFKVDPNDGEVQTINCPGGTKNAATHTSPDDKAKVSLNWIAPKDLEKVQVVFKATFVQEALRFWVNQTSSTLTIRH